VIQEVVYNSATLLFVLALVAQGAACLSIYMNIFGHYFGRLHKAKQLTPSRPAKRRTFRLTFFAFCAALLAESICLQLLTQLNTLGDTTGKVASAQSSAVGSVATPTPVAPTPASVISKVIPQALAAAPAEPETVVVVFHPPLRSYFLTQYFSAGHPAIDMAAVTGTPIYATTVGTVVATGYVLDGGGLMVKVTHPNGYISYYAHMSQITSTVGQHVDNQTQIGKVGMTGWATGPHLHFMVVGSNGKAINPLSILK
jgi:murein DD-endopeptidase MepM/ murein hydrolase activator NlpD